MQPILTNALAGPILNEKVGWRQWVGVILGFTGAAIVLGFDLGESLPSVGIIASFILGFSRAIGETMIVTIAGGQYPELNLDPRSAMYTITSSIVNVSLGDTPHGTTAYNALFALGITLFVMTFILNIFSDYIARKYRKEYE